MRPRLARLEVLSLAFCILLFSVGALSQKESAQAIVPTLPVPLGPHGVGRVAFDWVDQGRVDEMAENPAAHPELVVYIWYPTKATSKQVRGVLFPGAAKIDAAPGVPASIKDQVFGGNWSLVVSGAITSHAQEDAPLVKHPKTFPVIIFSPGANMTCFQYSSAIEDLVSHGYVVAAIEHTSEVFAVALPNGDVRAYSAKRIPKSFLPPTNATLAQTNAKLQEWYRHSVDVRAADQSFVLDKLTQLNGTSDNPTRFSGRLDLAHVAAVGHSRGGWASTLTCRRDGRVKACVNEDGTSNGEGLQFPGTSAPKQPILYVEVPPILPADWPVLKELHLTADEWVRRWHETAYKEFRTFPAGGYFVELNLPGLVHYSFTDEVVLRAAKDGAKEKEDSALRGLHLTENVARAFLDEYLKNEKQAELHDTSEMRVQRFVQKY
jgi:platelet-activating factor acetylhydrolase isoform II